MRSVLLALRICARSEARFVFVRGLYCPSQSLKKGTRRPVASKKPAINARIKITAKIDAITSLTLVTLMKPPPRLF